jgi:hypothetical protein
MGILDKLDQIVRAADVRPVRPADPSDWPVLSEPLDPTPGETFDLGATVDDENLTAAGGYPENIPTDASPIDAFRPKSTTSSAPGKTPDCGCKDKRRRSRRLVTVRYVITADDVTARRSLVVTPSGADSDNVVRVTLVASDENAITFAGDPDAAKVGAYLPPWFPITVEVGPVWIVGYLAGATVDVIVEYES